MKKYPSDTPLGSNDADVRAENRTTATYGRRSATNNIRVVCNDMGMRIDRNGVWYYHDSAIRRKELVCLFASVLTRNEAGEYWLITPAEMCIVEVEDVPFLAVELFSGGIGREQIISMRSNVDEIVSVDNDHSLYVVNDPETGEPSPYLVLRDGVEARLTRSVFYELVDLGLEEDIEGELLFGVWSSGSFFPLGRLDPYP